MSVLLSIPTAISLLLLAAHWIRAGNLPLALVTIAFSGLLVIRRPWATRLLQLLLLLAAWEWIATAIGISQDRIEDQRPWLRSALILGTVALFDALAAGLLELRLRRRSAFTARRPQPQSLRSGDLEQLV